MDETIRVCRDIFKQHSITYYYSTLIFPKEIRHRVYVLYAFVRLADEYVDNPEEGVDPKQSLDTFRKQFEEAWVTHTSEHVVVRSFVTLARCFHFEKSWIDAFFDSMALDLYKTRYSNFAELQEYIYGSAEVIGLMMSRIMRIDPSYDLHARALGTSMQLINFLRDIREDYERGRIYFPLDELKKYGITESNWVLPQSNSGHESFILDQIQRIRTYQHEADYAITAMSGRVRYAVSTASKGYVHTLDKIAQSPLTPFTTNISNTKLDIIFVVLKTLLPFS